MEKGKVYKIALQPMTTSNYFAAGHRIRIEVSSSNFPRFDRNMNTGGNNYDEAAGVVAHNTIHHSKQYPSQITITVVKRNEVSVGAASPLCVADGASASAAVAATMPLCGRTIRSSSTAFQRVTASSCSSPSMCRKTCSPLADLSGNDDAHAVQRRSLRRRSVSAQTSGPPSSSRKRSSSSCMPTCADAI